MLNIDGLASGLDTANIIEGLLSIQQQQVDRFNAKKQEITDQRAAFEGIEFHVSSVQASLAELTSPLANAFRRKTVTSGDETVLNATVSNQAAEGVYSLVVNQLARNHQIGSNDFSAADASLPDGTLSISVGSGQPVEVRTDGSLEGLAERINREVDDVTATVIKHSGGYKLLLSANKSGAANAINVTVTADNPAEQTLMPTFDLENPVQAAADAIVQIGSGAGAISINSDSNQLDDLFPGMTIDLHSTSEDQEIQLTVAADIESATASVQAFVDAFNGFVDYTNEQNSFDTTTNTAGVLFGNRALLSIRDDLARMVTSVVPALSEGIPRDLNRMSKIGIQIQNDGKLSFNSGELADILNGQVDGLRSIDLEGLFGYSADSSSEAIQFLSATSDTDTTVEYEVEVVQAATQASLVATNSLAASTVIDASNDELDIAIDGLLVSGLKLTQGTYTQQELADHLEAVINGSSEFPGREVRVTVNGSNLQIDSLSYGGASQVSQINGSAMAALGLEATDSAAGTDVVGSFSYLDESGTRVNETAAGSGRILRGESDNEKTSGLSVRVTLTPTDVGAGHTSELHLARGIGAQLDTFIESLTDVRRDDNGDVLSKGRIPNTYDEFDGRIASVDQSIDRLNAQFEAQQQSLVEQFTSLESRISELQGLSTILAAQLGSLPSINTGP